MMDKQKDVRRHIAAAKGWLNKADDSLEQENDIQGDLKLMLAHAELQRAQEKNAQKLYVRWFKRLTPPVVACLLALAGILYVQGSRPTEIEKTAGDATPVKIAAPAAQPQQPKLDADYGSSQEASVQQAPPQADANKVFANETDAEDIDTASKYKASNDDIPEQSQQEPEVPARELQKLMQSAGSVLRE